MWSDLPVPGAAANDGDCDDTDAQSHPWADDSCGDGLDTDCDGLDRSCIYDRRSDAVLRDVGTRLLGGGWSVTGGLLAAGDVDANGVTDIVAPGNLGFARPADGSDHGSGGQTLPFWTSLLEVGDVTGDGIDDLVALRDDVLLAAGPLSDPAEALLLFSPSDHPFVALAVGDATGDGIGDVAAVNSFGEYTLHTAPTWEVDAQIADAQTTGWPKVWLADADGDGIDDVWSNALCVYLSPQPATGAEAAGCLDEAGDSLFYSDLSIEDIDGDGTNDVALTTADAIAVVRGPIAQNQSLPAAAYATVAAPSTAMPRGPVAIASRPDEAEVVFRAADPNGAPALWMGGVSEGGRSISGAAIFSSCRTREAHFWRRISMETASMS